MRPVEAQTAHQHHDCGLSPRLFPRIPLIILRASSGRSNGRESPYPKDPADAMNDQSRFTLYEKLYFHELDRKDKLLARLNLPLAMIAGLLSFLSYLLNKAPSASDGWPGVFFWILYDCAFISFLLALWHFRKAWIRGGYDYVIPVLKRLEEHFQNDLKPYFGSDNDSLNSHFGMVIYDYYVTGATINATNNDERTKALDQLSKYVALCAVFAILSFIPFFIANHS